jgi:hypothetical protein
VGGGEKPVQYTICAQRTTTNGFVAVDSNGNVLVCSYVVATNLSEAVRAVPRVITVGDTLFVGALLVHPDLPDGVAVANVEWPEPYEVYYGPLPRGTTLRITNRHARGTGYSGPRLDTVITVPPAAVAPQMKR